MMIAVPNRNRATQCCSLCLDGETTVAPWRCAQLAAGLFPLTDASANRDPWTIRKPSFVLWNFICRVMLNSGRIAPQVMV